LRTHPSRELRMVLQRIQTDFRVLTASKRLLQAIDGIFPIHRSFK
jgi:hypothetical protein